MDETIHPDGFIKLLDGRVIAGHPKACAEPATDNSLSVDSSGEHLVIGKTAKAQIVKCEPDRELRFRQQQFSRNIPLFLSNAERILGDSRMFLAPVDVGNGLSITGKSGFQGATLGVYVEWWRHCHDAAFDTEDNPVWFISGSPLSGCHACASADSEGNSSECNLRGRFCDTWRSFMDVNRRYDDIKPRYEAFGLNEVIEMLQRPKADL